MRVVQVVLILGMLAVIIRLLRTRSARGQALRRLGTLAFGFTAILSIIMPESWTAIANLAGVGRGADMILYGLVVSFLGYTVTSYGRFRELEMRQTILTRKLAIAEAPDPSELPNGE